MQKPQSGGNIYRYIDLCVYNSGAGSDLQMTAGLRAEYQLGGSKHRLCLQSTAKLSVVCMESMFVVESYTDYNDVSCDVINFLAD